MSCVCIPVDSLWLVMETATGVGDAAAIRQNTAFVKCTLNLWQVNTVVLFAVI